MTEHLLTYWRGGCSEREEWIECVDVADGPHVASGSAPGNPCCSRPDLPDEMCGGAVCVGCWVVSAEWGAETCTLTVREPEGDAG